MPMLRTPTATALAGDGAYAAFRPLFQFRLLRSCGAGGSPAGKGRDNFSGRGRGGRTAHHLPGPGVGKWGEEF